MFEFQHQDLTRVTQPNLIGSVLPLIDSMSVMHPQYLALVMAALWA